MKKDFPQIDWNEAVEHDCRQIVRLAVSEDLGRWYDWTTVSLVPQSAAGHVAIVARRQGIIAGSPAVKTALSEMGITVQWQEKVEEGANVEPGDPLVEISGSARDLLTAERLMLNLLGRLSGIATLTRKYVDSIADTSARIYDTRKTTPGWRLLEKYAVHCGGGNNHRTGLYDAILIKDNHLALGAGVEGAEAFTPAQAVNKARDFVQQMLADDPRKDMIIEIEVDTLEQLEQVLPVDPEIVLLDNMSPQLLRQAVELRDRLNPHVELEASGEINLETVHAVALSGVDRLSVGALTHSAVSLDVGLDWRY